MQDFEKLGVFYLGREYDLVNKKSRDGLILYDSKDLVTHAVTVGMTGSGKTGLCISLLEEAAIDGIPALVIDPKGDLANMLLAFPELRGEDFAPWVNEEDARRKGVEVAEFAAQQAELWKSGLGKWGQDGARIQRMRDAADFAIYTPGSDAGIPVAILKSLSAPSAAVRQDRELLRERITATVTALLALLGIEADPIQSREHILLSNILGTAWKEEKELDLAALIQQIQTPPFARIGVMDLESFCPSKERFSLAMSLNNLLASPGFEAWMTGEPLEIGNFLHTPQGKPRISIFSIAHLSESERMFFVSLLLNQVVSWMRTQSGTTSLRAIVYMDEIFGYFPPVANPPSKLPLLTLLKQARAFGVGVVLATQNPVDLDYKGLANTGTWFIGRLQTERDKMRVLDGLEGAAASTGAKFDRSRMEEILAGLGNRVFLLNNVHEDAPVIFESRWALSYLRGPLTRSQIKLLTDPQKTATPQPVAEQAARAVETSVAAERPVLPPEVPQCFLPARAQGEVTYQPMLMVAGQVRFSDTKTKVDLTRDLVVLAPLRDQAVPVVWEETITATLDPNDVEKDPPREGAYGVLPPGALKPRSYAAWTKEFVQWVYSTQKVDLFRSPSLQQISNPDEGERDFRIRLQQTAREGRDRDAEALRQRYAPKETAIQEKIRRAQQVAEREAEQAKAQKFQTVVSVGTTLLSAFLGRKVISASSVSKAGTALRTATRIQKESQDAARATETVEALQQQLADLGAQFQAEAAAVAASSDPMTEKLETIAIKPKKTGITTRLVTLAWAPYSGSDPAW